MLNCVVLTMDIITIVEERSVKKTDIRLENVYLENMKK